MLQAELVPRIHPFRRECGADSSSSDLHSGIRIGSRVRFLPSHGYHSAMAGFRPRSVCCFGTASCAQLRSSGFTFLLRRSLPISASSGYCTSDGNIKLLEKAKSCAFPSATIHDMGVICKRFEKNIPHLSHPLEKSRKLCQNKENRPGGVLTAQRLDETN